MINWLLSTRYNDTHVAVRARREESTGKWFIEKIQTWLAELNRLPFFWCKGIPGAGKTVLMSAVVDYVESKPDVCIAYIYFNYKQQESQTASLIYASLVVQLLNRVPDLQAHVENLHKRCDNGKKSACAEELFDMLIHLPSSSKIVLAFDALDEASVDTREDLLSRLARLETTSLLVFITSRPGIDIGSISAKTRIENVTAQTSDLEEFIQKRLQNDKVKKILGENSKRVVPKIVQNLTSRAAGMFLLVVFQIEHICNKTCAAQMLQASEEMPSDPDSIYARTMHQIKSQSDESQIQLATRVLSYLVLARRNLSVHELTSALAIKPGTTELDSIWKCHRDTLTEVCRGLVVIDNNSSIIHLAHLTLQHYLLQRELPVIEEVKKEICPACITYLSFDVFKESPCKNEESLRDRMQTHVFLDYASHQLTAHLHELNEKDIFTEEIRHLAISREISESYLQIYFSNKRSGLRYQRYPSGTSAWHIAALLGHMAVMRILLAKESIVLDSKDEDGRTPLSWAAEYGRKAVVKLLLEKGAKLKTKDKYGQTPLSWAARYGHEAVVKLLLEKGTELETKDTKCGWTPLSWAVGNGHEAVVKLLLENGAELETIDKYGWKPLSRAARNGREAAVKLLLEKGAKLETIDEYGWTPLSQAASNGHKAVVKLLLEKGAELETISDNSRTPLSWAAVYGHEAVVKQLLEKGAKLRTKDAKYNWKPLLWAAGNGHKAVVKLLLEKGTELETKDKYYSWTPLSWAARNGHEAVVKLLLEKGAELETISDYGRTLLSYAAENGHMAVVKLLLEKGAKLETKDNYGRTQLSYAASNGHEAVVKLLLEKGAKKPQS